MNSIYKGKKLIYDINIVSLIGGTDVLNLLNTFSII